MGTTIAPYPPEDFPVMPRRSRSAAGGPGARTRRRHGRGCRPAVAPRVRPESPRSPSAPSGGDDLLARVELDGVAPVGVQVALHRVLPAGEREPGDRRRDPDVDADHP